MITITNANTDATVIKDMEMNMGMDKNKDMENDKNTKSNLDIPVPEELSESDKLMATTHYFRGEMDRMNTWRRRLDVTTNWAIVTTAAFLSFGFGNKDVTHLVFILATIFVFFFLIIEARRYKYYDLWRWRIALLSENFFARIISPGRTPLIKQWRQRLSRDMQQSQFKISFGEAFGRRLRRNYGWIFFVLAGCWVTKVMIHPIPADDISEILERAGIFHLIPGWLVIGTGVVFNGTLLVWALVTLKQRKKEVTIYPASKSKFKLPNL